MNVGLHINRQLKLLYRNEEVELENIYKKFYNMKYSNSCTGLTQAQRFPQRWGSQISKQSADESGKVVSPTHRPPLTPENIPGTHFC
jgi:hypothetical protein